MEFEDFLSYAGLDSGTAEKLLAARHRIDITALKPHIDALAQPETAYSAYVELKSRLGDDPDGIKMLLCQLKCARGTREDRIASGVPEDVYAATMGCFARFIAETERRTGRAAFDRGWWTWRQLSGTLLRIGALEYEARELAGEGVISIHIPSDADLRPATVDASLKRARGLISERFGNGRRFTCSSWLLSPALVPLLSEGSNIMAFRRRFDITEWDRNGTDFIQWLFEVPDDTPISDLPGRTSLQRGVRELLLSGGKVGAARGWLRELEE